VTNSFRNLIIGNSFVSNQEGIDLTGAFSSLNNVTRNLFRSASFTGVFLLYHPLDNTFAENTFTLNHIGVDMQNATGNTFYHNSFLRTGLIINGRVRHINHVFSSDGLGDVWDNRSLGLPRGGNYWDNYTGVDVDNDGIGNSNLPADGLDSYPLMAPFVPVPIAVISVVPSKMSGTVPLTVSFNTDVLGTLKPFTYAWNFGDNSSTSNLAVPSHTYITVGNYVVTITVKDASGSSSSGTVNVSVVSAPAMGINTYLEAGGVLAAGAAVLGVIYYRRRRRRTTNGPVAGARLTSSGRRG